MVPIGPDSVIAAAALQGDSFPLLFLIADSGVQVRISSKALPFDGRQRLCCAKERGCSQFHSSDAASFSWMPNVFLRLLILSHCCWMVRSGSCVVSSSSTPLPPLAFLDDTMQGMSGRKLRLEGGETLQSSPVTMRWFSCRSLAGRPPLYPPFLFFVFLLGASPVFDLSFSHLLVVADWTVCRQREHSCIFVLSGPVVLKGNRMNVKCVQERLLLALVRSIWW